MDLTDRLFIKQSRNAQFCREYITIRKARENVSDFTEESYFKQEYIHKMVRKNIIPCCILCQ